MQKNPDKLTCPECHGTKTGYGFRCFADGRVEHSWPCSYCEATGLITAERMAARERGMAFRKEREGRDETLRACATRLSTSPVTISLFERGLVDAI